MLKDTGRWNFVTDGRGAGQAFELPSLELGLATFKLARAAGTAAHRWGI
jgi:hypothetical protein